MGSLIEVNDTLQISKKQGFPKDLDIETHLKKPFTAEYFEGKIFEFFNKKEIRVYQRPPVRNFLVENVNGKWLCWGMVLITEITHDYVKETTSGKFTIKYIYSPAEMKEAFKIIFGSGDKESYF